MTDPKTQQEPYDDPAVLVLTPTGRDAQLVCRLLEKAGVAFVCCDSLEDTIGMIADGKGPAIIAEEALTDDSLCKELLEIIEAQPEWSDLPVLILRGRGRRGDCVEELAKKWSVQVLHRPLNFPDFVSIVRSTILARRRQISLKKTTETLRNLATDLADQAQLLELAHDAIFVHDMEGRIIYWNRGAEITYGYSRDEVVGKISHEVLKTVYPHSIVKVTGHLLGTGHWEGELAHTTRQGGRIMVESRWALRKTEEGKPVAILEIDRDITQRKQAELRMQETRQYAESIVETVQVALLVLSPKLKVQSANKTFYDIFSTTPQETEGKPIFELGNGQWNVPELRVLLKEILPKNTSFEDFEVEREFENIGLRTMLLNARRLYRSGGKTQLILLSMQDITPLRLQQQRIREDQERIASLTEELLMAEERERRRIAVDLHDTIGQILAFSKREIGMTQKTAPAEISQNLVKVKDQISKAIKQTRDLTFELSPQTLYTFGLETAVQELAEKFSEEHGPNCYLHSDDKDKPLPEKLKVLLYRCVRELLMNIAKHAKAKNVHIHIKRKDTNIEITVADDGEGFDPVIIESAANSKKFGLASIRERLKRLGGRFNIESSKGAGCKAKITAPLKVTNIKETTT